MRIEEVCSCRRARQPARALCVSVQSYGRFVFQVADDQAWESEDGQCRDAAPPLGCDVMIVLQ